MKRIAENAAAVQLNDLLEYAAGFDENRFELDDYEVHNLLECLASKAQRALTVGSELRLRTVRVGKYYPSCVKVRLERHAILFQSSSAA